LDFIPRQEELLQQFDDLLCKSEDNNPEHYRYKTFNSILSKREFLTDTIIEQYIELAKIDPDPSMAKSALILLAKFNGLLLNQIEYGEICTNHPKVPQNKYRKK
jgi:hypothetical protein